jgi:CheY-like chemotaxis protein
MGTQVLVVDDDRLSRESLCEALAELGCQVDDADRGLAAFARLSTGRRDLVVSDVDMPDISGFELLARLRRASIACPTILVSARADAELSRAAAEAGATALLAKPVAMGRFTLLVSQVLHL